MDSDDMMIDSDDLMNALNWRSRQGTRLTKQTFTTDLCPYSCIGRGCMIITHVYSLSWAACENSVVVVVDM